MGGGGEVITASALFQGDNKCLNKEFGGKCQSNPIQPDSNPILPLMGTLSELCNFSDLVTKVGAIMTMLLIVLVSPLILHPM